VIAVPGGRSGQREIRRGPHAEAKWLAGSVACDAGEVIAAAFNQAEARDPARAHLGSPGGREPPPDRADPSRGRPPES
jgi:hypothetical protein